MSSPLHYAAEYSHTDAMQLLIDHGANINKKGGSDLTPMHWAVVKVNMEAIQLLIDNGADVNAADNEGWTSMKFAFHMLDGHRYDDVVSMIQLLAANGGHR